VTTASPLSDSEKLWLQHFERKLGELHGGNSYSTAFLDPRQLELAEALLAKIPGLAYSVYGGYPEAERSALAVYPAQQKGTLPPVTVVMVEWGSEDSEISHRDLLGAVLALGLRRDQVGDIIMLQEGGAALMVAGSKAEYVCANLLQVGRMPVSCAVTDSNQLPTAKDDGREIKGTVASLRADAVLSLGFGISRSRVVLLVKGGVVKVNWRPINSPSQQLKEGDQVSLKGRGRLLISEVEGETRKGRIRLKLKKYS
jgi:RNA-binding protein YlmH